MAGLPLPKLEDGAYYCGRDGETCMDHLGNWYQMVPATPAPAQTPKPTPKPITLSERARAEIAPMLDELASKASEHSLWCVTDGHGMLLEAFSTSSGHDDRDESDHRVSLERVIKTPGRKGLFLVHNHPRLPEGGGGESKPSPQDRTFTQWVKDRLKPFEIELIDHQVIGARSTESRSVDAKDAPTEPLGKTEAWDRTIDDFVKRLESRYGVRPQLSEAQGPVELYEAEYDYPSEWHARQAAWERQLATEPKWLADIRESTRRRFHAR